MRISALLCLFGLAIGRGSAETFAVNQPYDQLPGTVITPHIVWANPYSLGKTKVLVIAPTWSQRETVELAQRLSLDYSPLMAFNSKDLLGEKEKNHEAEVPADIARRMIRERLTNDYDAIIIGKMEWDGFPLDMKVAILEKVKTQGCGLLYVSPMDQSKELEAVLNNKTEDTETFITTGIPFSFLPLLKDIPREGLISLARFGKGRICMLNYKQDVKQLYPHQSLTPSGIYDSSAQYDYYHSLLAKALLWTAKKMPDILISEIKPSEPVIKREAQNDSTIKLTAMSKRTAEASLEVELIIRDDKTGEIEYGKKEKTSLKPGANEISFKMPKLRDGQHLADVWFREKESVVNWGTAGFEIKGEGPRMEAVVLDKPSYKNGEIITGRVVMRQVLGSDRQMKIKLVDSFGRQMLAQSLEGKEKEVPFSFKLEHALAHLLAVAAELCEKDGSVVQKLEKEFPCPERSLDDFSFILWAGALPSATDYVLQLYLRELPKYGVDTMMDKVKGYAMTFPEQLDMEVANVSRANLKFLPVLCHFGPLGSYEEGDGGPIRGRKSGKYCLTNPGYREEVKKDITRKIQAMGPYGPLAYSFGDENELATKGKDACFSPTCQEDFRVWLKKEYGTLDALNKEWGTNYTEWFQAKPITLAQAKKNGRFAQWGDHREHMDEVFANMFGYCRDVAQQIDPDARTGSEGFGELNGYSGQDWNRLLKVMNLCGVYGGFGRPNNEIVRSLAGKDCLTGMYFGSYVGGSDRFCSYSDPTYSGHYMESFPWYSLFNGINSVFWWMGFPSQGLGGPSIFTPDFSPLPGFATASGEIMEIKSGIGKLLLDSQRADNGIAVFFSPASVRASEFSCKETTVQDAMSDLISLLEDVGLQYRFFSSEEIEQGKLSKGNYKVLMLPFSQALSSQEAEQMKTFVKNGGVLIADYSPGIMDEHCKRRAQPALAGMINTNVCPSVTKFGQGKGIYYGGRIFKEYFKHRETGESATAKTLMLKILKAAGIEPGVKITRKSGEAFWPVEISIFTNNDAEYVALQRDYTIGDLKPVDAIIQLPRQAHVYVARENKALGLTDKVELTLLPGRGEVLALLPYEVEKIEVGINKEYRQGEPVKYKVSLAASAGKCGTHVVRLEIKGPEGKILPWYSQNLLIKGGEYEGVIPLCLNEKEGEYSLTLRDVASGKKTEQAFKVKKEE